MRGVFLIPIFIFTITLGVLAAEVDFELSGTIGSEETSYKFSMDMNKDSTWSNVYWGIDVAVKPSAGLDVETRWELQLPQGGPICLRANHNKDHYTSPDLFRLINKNNYGADSYFVGLHTEQVQLGFLRDIPLRNLDLVDAIFCASELQLGPARLSTLQLRFAGRSESGSAGVLTGEGEFGNWRAQTALGWQIDSAGTCKEGSVFNLTRTGRRLQADFSWQKIEPGFWSPLAKSNKYASNRVGWKLEISSVLKDLSLSLNLRQHTNLAETREYPQLSWKLNSELNHTGLEWRLQPTQAFILRYAENDVLVQLDALRSTLRYDSSFGDSQWSFRIDGKRMIARVQVKFTNRIELRLIGKHDFLHSRSHYSMLAKLNGANKHLQFELGQYDRGNMTSGFNNPFSFCISWSWKF